MSIEKWVAAFGQYSGPVFTAGIIGHYSGRGISRIVREVSLHAPPVGAYTASAGDWWVYE